MKNIRLGKIPKIQNTEAGDKEGGTLDRGIFYGIIKIMQRSVLL